MNDDNDLTTVAEDDDSDDDEDQRSRETLMLVASYLSRVCPRTAATLGAEIEELELLGRSERWDASEGVVSLAMATRGLPERDLVERLVRPATTVEGVPRLGDGRVIVRPPEPVSLLWPRKPVDAASAAERLARAARDLRVAQKANLQKTIDDVSKVVKGGTKAIAVEQGVDEKDLRRSLVEFRKKKPFPRETFTRRTVSGHRGYAAYCVAFDARGDFVITGADDHLVKIWHAPSGLLRSTLRGHRSVISDVAVSPDNRCVASGSDDGTVRLWRFRDGLCLAVLTIGPKVPLHLAEASASASASVSAPQVVVGGQSRGQEQPVRGRQTQQQPQVTMDVAASRQAGLCPVDIVAFDAATGALYAAGASCPDVRVWDARSLAQKRTDRLLRGGALPHHDASLGGGNVLKVRSLAVASTGAYAATSTTDGAVRLWRCADFSSGIFDDFIDAETDLTTFLNVASHDAAARHSALKDSLLRTRRDLETEMMLTEFAPKTTDRETTDLQFSRANDRLLAASMAGCTARILSWVLETVRGRLELWRSATLDLHVLDPDDKPVKPQRQQNGRIPVGKRELSSVAWTCDDTLIVCTSYKRAKKKMGFETPGDQRVDIFDALSGRKIRSLRAHSYVCFAIAPHPRDRNRLLTGGHDGALRSWDLQRSEPMTTEFIAPPPLDRPAPVTSPVPGEIWSITWSGDGMRFAAVDLAGQLHIFGPRGNGDPPRSQYLSSDYAELVWDANLYAVDAATRVGPHLAPREFFRNYLSQQQEVPVGDDSVVPLVDEREAPHKDEKGHWIFAATSVPVPLSENEDARRISQLRERRNLDLSKDTFALTDPRGLSYQSLAGARFWWPEARSLLVLADANSFPVLVPATKPKPSRKTSPRPATVRGISYESIDTSPAVEMLPDDSDDEDFVQVNDDVAEEEDDDDLEVEQPHDLRSSNNRGRRRSFSRLLGGDDDSSDEDDDHVPVLRSQTQRLGPGQRLGGDEERGRRRRVLFAPEEAIPDDDDDDDDEEFEVPSSRNRSRPRRRIIPEEEEEEEEKDDEDFVEPPRRRRRRRERRISQEEDDDDEEDKDEDEESPALESDSPDEKQDDSDDDFFERKAAEAEREDEGPTVDRSWARLSKVPKFDEAEFLQYAPQCGDEIVYIPQGHAAHVVEIGIDALGNFGAPWRVVPTLQKLVSVGGHGAIACRVSEVQYELPPQNQACRSVIARVDLVAYGVVVDVRDPLCNVFGPIDVALREIEPRRSPRRSSEEEEDVESEVKFSVLFRRADTPEFLIPQSKYERALARRDLYHEGAKANFPMVDGPSASRYSCTVDTVRFRPGTRRHRPEEVNASLWDFEGPERSVASTFNLIKIVCDDGSPYDCSPWEIEPPQHDDDDDVWPSLPRLPDATVSSLVDALQTVAHFDDFQHPVTEMFPGDAVDYLAKVPVPVELDLIAARLSNGYYRHLDAVEADVIRISTNSDLFNGVDTLYSKTAAALRDTLLSVIANIRTPPPPEDEEEPQVAPRRSSRKRPRDDDDDASQSPRSERPTRTKRTARLRTAGTSSPFFIIISHVPPSLRWWWWLEAMTNQF